MALRETTALKGVPRARLPRAALALGLAGVTCLVLLMGRGAGRSELIATKNGGGSDSIYAETGMVPDAPKKPMVHHPHHPGLKPNAMTAAEYEAKRHSRAPVAQAEGEKGRGQG